MQKKTMYFKRIVVMALSIMLITVSQPIASVFSFLDELEEESNELSQTDNSQTATSINKKYQEYSSKNNQEINAENVYTNTEFIDSEDTVLNIVDSDLGTSTTLKLQNNKPQQFKGAMLEVKRCVQSKKTSLIDDDRAFLTMTDVHDGKVLFNGWIMSTEKSFAQPIYEHYFFTLNRCMIQK